MPPILGGIKVDTSTVILRDVFRESHIVLGRYNNMLTPDFLLNKCRMFFGGGVLKRDILWDTPKIYYRYNRLEGKVLFLCFEKG